VTLAPVRQHRWTGDVEWPSDERVFAAPIAGRPTILPAGDNGISTADVLTVLIMSPRRSGGHLSPVHALGLDGVPGRIVRELGGDIIDLYFQRIGGTMTHWQHRPEPAWRGFQFNQPYAKGLKRLKEDVLAKTDFDPATLWQWGTMQAMAVIEVLKTCERLFGLDGQQAVYDALHHVGLDVGRQILAGTEKPESMSEAEFLSFYATIINRIAYASLERAKIDSDDQVSFDILWCPHQDHYGAFDCRVQRYFVEGMIDAMREFGQEHHFDVRFDSTIPAGAPTCHFTMWRRHGEDDHDHSAWQEYTVEINERALEIARREMSAAEVPSADVAATAKGDDC
jgi:hypothetical protein